jgi:hypothetical protein
MKEREAAGAAPVTMCFGCWMMASICGYLNQGKRSERCARTREDDWEKEEG